MRNLPLMIMALILSLLSWVVAIEEADPTLERRFPVPIPVTVTDLPEDLEIVGTFDETVRVTVQTVQSVWDTLAVDDFEATVDLSGLEPGVYEVAVDVDLRREPSRITDMDPQVLVIELEPRDSQRVPVRLEIDGRPAVGYVSRTELVEPREVMVEGPASYVTRVADVFASLSVQDAQGSIEEILSVTPRDAEGNSVPYVSLTPDNVHVRLAVEPTGYHATLAVKAVLTGEVASGYRITDIAIDPPTVTIFGHPDELAALEQGFVETRAIAVDEATDDVVVRPGLSPPPQMAIVPGTRVEVVVSIEAIQSSMTITVTPEIQGLQQGYTATLSPDTVELILSGPLPKLQVLAPGEVRILLDLFDLDVGTHQLVPDVSVPQEITAQVLVPRTIQVRIAEIVEPTPTPDHLGEALRYLIAMRWGER